MKTDSKIYVCPPHGFTGAAVVKGLRRRGHTNLIDAAGAGPDLRDMGAVEDFFSRERPEYVFHAAGKTAGIMGNVRFPAELMLDNLLAACHVLDAAHRHGVKKLLYLASGCCYPKHCAQPMKEEALLTGPLEPTNEPYAVAKIAGIELCRSYRRQYGVDFICAIPTNTFGPGDDFSPDGSHVAAALMRRMHEAKQEGVDEVVIWGTGTPRRELLYVEDLADACLCLMDGYSDVGPINIGGGECRSIAELAELIRKVTGYRGSLVFDPSKPDGMPEKRLETGRLSALGWRCDRSFETALQETYAWYVTNAAGRCEA